MIWVLVAFGLYALVLVGISYFSLHPVRTPVFISPGAMDQPQEDIEFESRGLKLRGWFVDKPGDVVAVFCHGYLMNRCELTPLACQLAKHGVSALLFDFPAHGKSQGRKCSLGWGERKDVAAAVEFARSKKPGCKVILVGSSMGAAASAFALAEDPAIADGLILDSAYSRLPQAISGWWRFLGGPVLSFFLTPSVLIAAPLAGFNPFKVDVSASLCRVMAPVLILHGDCDNLATPAEARRNEGACGGEKTVVWLPGCGHSEGRWEHPDIYYGAVLDFLRSGGWVL